jgi:hypothetical protein
MSGFPAWRVDKRRALYRAHHASVSPWWFASNGDGRFDLDEPCGTCYVALDRGTALRERLGPRIVAADAVPISLLDDAVVSRLHLPASRRVADVTAEAATAFGVTREINTTTRYDITQQWASAWHELSLGGVRYAARFSTGSDALAVGLFGDAGVGAWPVDANAVPAADVARSAGLVGESPPRKKSLTWEPAPVAPGVSR